MLDCISRVVYSSVIHSRSTTPYRCVYRFLHPSCRAVVVRYASRRVQLLVAGSRRVSDVGRPQSARSQCSAPPARLARFHEVQHMVMDQQTQPCPMPSRIQFPPTTPTTGPPCDMPGKTISHLRRVVTLGRAQPTAATQPLHNFGQQPAGGDALCASGSHPTVRFPWGISPSASRR